MREFKIRRIVSYTCLKFFKFGSRPYIVVIELFNLKLDADIDYGDGCQLNCQ